MTAGSLDQSLFRDAGDAWWSGRAFRSLRAVKTFQLERLTRLLDRSLDGLDVVDVGCGGGLLSVPLAALGARVVGVDIEASCIRIAEEAARSRDLPGRFVVGDAAKLPLDDGAFDVVVLSDVLEHVDRPATAIAEAARVLRPGGMFYVNTINRSAWAEFWAITVAEGLGFVPRGTHDARLFVTPAELVSMAGAAGLRLLAIEGEAPRILTSLRTNSIRLRRSRSLGVAYGALFRRAPA